MPLRFLRDVFEAWRHPEQVDSMLVTRFEVIDRTSGRLLVRYGVAVELSYQDESRTLKVFLKDRP